MVARTQDTFSDGKDAIEYRLGLLELALHSVQIGHGSIIDRHLVQRFLITRVCSVCHGTRLRPEALTSQLGGRNIAEISALGLGELSGFAAGLPAAHRGGRGGGHLRAGRAA